MAEEERGQVEQQETAVSGDLDMHDELEHPQPETFMSGGVQLTKHRLLRTFDTTSSVVAWPSQTAIDSIRLPVELDQLGLLTDSGFVNLDRLRQPVRLSCIFGCDEQFTDIFEAAAHILSINPCRERALATARSDLCFFQGQLGQACGARCSTPDHFLRGDGVYCPCGLPFESIYHLADHVQRESDQGESDHPILDPTCQRLSLSEFLRCVQCLRFQDHRRPLLSDPASYSASTFFMFRDSTAVLKKTLPMPEYTRIPYLSDSTKANCVWTWRETEQRRYISTDKDVGYSAIYHEHHTVFGLSDTDLLIVAFYARSRDTPLVPSRTTGPLWKEITADAAGSKSIRTSAIVTALILDILQVNAARGFKGSVITCQDSLTCDLIHLGELCTTAKPFDLDIKIMDAEIAIIRTESERAKKPIGFPPSTKRADIKCFKVATGFWFRFDSHALGEAISVYSQTPDCEIDLAFLYLFAFMEGKQARKDKIMIRPRKPVADERGELTSFRYKMGDGEYTVLREAGLHDIQERLKCM